MAERIVRLGRRHGDAAGCVVCHGGDPTAQDASSAHLGAPAELSAAGGPDAFYPGPGDGAVADRTCGQCHEGYAQRWRKSAMSTGAASIERNQCRPAREKRARLGDVTRRFGRYSVVDADGHEPAAGTTSFKLLMSSLRSQRPEIFADRLLEIPAQPGDWSAEDSATYCRTCHGEPEGPTHRSSCSLCHMAYGPYQGRDPTIARGERDTIASHRIRGGAPSLITHSDGHEEVLPGIVLSTCLQCHFDPRLAGTNPIGDAHVHTGGGPDGSGGSLLCQDCHTSIEIHGDGNIPVVAGVQLEVRCEDCHGTTDRFPWELPLGFRDRDGPSVLLPGARGYAAEQHPEAKTDRLAGGDLLLTSKGNPFGNVVRVGDTVVLHSASGKTLEVTLLKSLAERGSWRSDLSRQVKSGSEYHRTMTCNDCHADWLPPCLGCHEDDERVAVDPDAIRTRSQGPRPVD